MSKYHPLLRRKVIGWLIDAGIERDRDAVREAIELGQIHCKQGHVAKIKGMGWKTFRFLCEWSGTTKYEDRNNKRKFNPPTISSPS
jgi:hypothetical protein